MEYDGPLDAFPYTKYLYILFCRHLSAAVGAANAANACSASAKILGERTAFLHYANSVL